MAWYVYVQRGLRRIYSQLFEDEELHFVCDHGFKIKGNVVPLRSKWNGDNLWAIYFIDTEPLYGVSNAETATGIIYTPLRLGRSNCSPEGGHLESFRVSVVNDIYRNVQRNISRGICHGKANLFRRKLNVQFRPLFNNPCPNRLMCLPRLPRYYSTSNDNSPYSDSIGPCYEYVPPGQVILGVISFVLAGFLLFRRERRSDTTFLVGCLIFFGGVMLLFGHEYYCSDKQSHSNHPPDTYIPQSFQHNSEIVPQKNIDFSEFSGYINTSSRAMANVLNMDKQIMVIRALAEGSSIRSIERMTGVHRDTIMRLGVKVGQGCTATMDSSMRNLPCTRLGLDCTCGGSLA